MAREQNVKQVDKFCANASGINYDSLAQPWRDVWRSNKPIQGLAGIGSERFFTM